MLSASLVRVSRWVHSCLVLVMAHMNTWCTGSTRRSARRGEADVTRGRSRVPATRSAP